MLHTPYYNTTSGELILYNLTDSGLQVVYSVPATTDSILDCVDSSGHPIVLAAGNGTSFGYNISIIVAIGSPTSYAILGFNNTIPSSHYYIILRMLMKME